jgi:hypothetical protein
MVEMVETMLKLHKDLPKAKTPTGTVDRAPREFRGHNKRFWMPVHLILPARRDKMVEMVETMLKLHKDLPKAKTPTGTVDRAPRGLTEAGIRAAERGG